MNRNRFLYLLLISLTIAAGLASRHFSGMLPNWVGLYLGDVLWALMVYFGMAFIFKRKPILWIACATLTFSFAIEASQLYHTVWIDAIRQTRLGGLILGFGFLWGDLVCYSIGTLLGVNVEGLLLKKQKRLPEPSNNLPD